MTDLRRSISFFTELFGWKPTEKDNTHIAFFDMGGWLLALFPREALADDITLPSPNGSGFSGITLGHNVPAKTDVAKMLARAEKLGGKVVKPAQDVFWGGHSGYFTDLDGHYWEVAWNPHGKLKADGTLDLA